MTRFLSLALAAVFAISLTGCKSEAESVFNAICGPKQLVVFDRAMHEPCVGVDNTMWAGKVTDFLLAAPRPRF